MKKYENRLNSLVQIGKFVRKSVVPLVAGIVLLLEANGFVQASVTVSGNIMGVTEVIGEGIDAGVAFTGGTASAGQWGTVSSGGTGYTLRSNIIVTDIRNGSNRAVGVITNDDAGVFNLINGGVLRLEGSATGGISGFVYANTPSFSGTINAGARNITITNNSGGAWGVSFTKDGGSASHADLGATSIRFGNIDVTGTITTPSGTGAIGFTAGISEADIILGNVTARVAVNGVGNSATAKGVSLQGQNSGTLTTGNILVVGANGAMLTGSGFGIQIGDIDPSVTGNLAGSLHVKGGITVRATDRAAGLQVTGAVDGKIAIDNTITVESNTANGAAVGINIGSIGNGGSMAVHGDINVSANASARNNGTAIPGLLAAGIASTGQIDGDVTVKGTINVTSKGDAAGFGTFGAGISGTSEVNLGKIIVNSTTTEPTSDARGVLIDGNVEGTLTAGDIKVNSAGGNAIGVHIIGGVNNGQFGAITATSGNKDNPAPTAVGIWTVGDSVLNLSGDITAEGFNARGILVEGHGSNADIIVDGNISISAKSTSTAGTSVGVDVDNALRVRGNGSADLGTVKVGGDFTVGHSGDTITVALDITKSEFGGTNEITGNAKLEVYGDINGAGFTSVTFNNLNASNFRNVAEFTNWSIATTGEIAYNGIRQHAHMGDGYLAASAMHNRYAAWHSVRGHLISGDGSVQRRNSPRRNVRGQSPCDPVMSSSCDPCSPCTAYDLCAPCDPCDLYDSCDPCSPVAPASASSSRKHNVFRSVWINYAGRSDGYYSAFHGQNWRLSADGIQSGVDLFRTKRSQLGVLLGYEWGKMYNVDDRVNMNDLYVGAYGVRVLRNGADIRGVFAYGFQDYDMRRFAKGGNLYTSSFNGETMEANLEIGKRLSAGPLSLRPAVAADVFNNKLKGAAEAGGVTYNKVDLMQVFLRTGTELRYQGQYFTLNSGIYYAYDVIGETLKTGVRNSLGQQSQLVGSRFGRELLTFNFGGECRLTQKFSVFGGYQGAHALDRTNPRLHSTGYLGAGLHW